MTDRTPPLRQKTAPASFLTLTLLLGMTAGCGEGSPGGVVLSGPPIDRLVVAPISSTISIGGSVQLTATAFAEDGTEIDAVSVRWQSGNTSVVSVSNAGLVTGVTAGAASVTATGSSGGTTASASAAITVVSGPTE